MEVNSVRETTLGSFNERENQPENIATLTPEDEKREGQSAPTTADLHIEDVSLNPTLTNTTNGVPSDATPAAEEENTTSFSISLPEETTVIDANKPAETSQNHPQISWQDAIKTVDRKELAKAAGISDFALEMDEYIAKGGQPIDYLQAKAIDYSKIPDAELVKNDLRKQFPDMSEDRLNLYLEKKYKQGELEDDDEKFMGEMELKSIANQIRQREIAKQQSFKIPETPIAANQKEWEAQQQQAADAAKIAAKQQIDFLMGHEATKALLENKRVVFDLGEGIKPFNVKLDERSANHVMKMITDGETFQKATSNDKGEPNVALLQKAALYISNPNHDRDIFNAGKAAGLRSVVEENQNAVRPNGGAVVNMQNQGVVYKGQTTLGARSTS